MHTLQYETAVCGGSNLKAPMKLDFLRSLCAQPKVVAIGEIGLDYYWDKEPEVQKQQRYWFAEQMKLAREASLPVIIHSFHFLWRNSS